MRSSISHRLKTCWLIWWIVAGAAVWGMPAVQAQELLLNRSFEAPVAPANGNNFYTSITGWAVTSDTGVAQPVNLIKAHPGYANNPTVTPPTGGAQYLDVNSSAGKARQAVILPTNGMIDFSGWYSVRDFPQVLTGLVINIRNSSNTVVASVSTSFSASDPIGLWKLASATKIPLVAGSYTYEMVIPDFANVDLASLVFYPALTMAKSRSSISDPVNNLTNPKMIPGGISEFLLGVTNPALYTVDSNTVMVVDATPANTQLVVADIGSAGSGPAAFVQGAPSSTLAYTFTSLSSASDDIDFSSDGGTTWTYSPVADANGADGTVSNIRLRPKGTMASGSSFQFRLRYRVQ